MVFYRDTGGFLPYVTKIWLYVTPVLYFVREIPPNIARVPAVEPAVPVVRGARADLQRAVSRRPATCSRPRRGRSDSSSSEPLCSSRESVTLPSGSDRPPAVWVDDLWISFRVTREKNQTLKGTLAGMRDRSRRAMLIEALRGVSFEVPAGSVYGVIGRNGAGKSTLLRTIAGILPPTSGRVAVWGRVTPLLSLGVGFNRELTGRENILLGGLTAGLTVGRGLRELRRGRGVRRASATRSTSRCAPTRRACSAASRSRSAAHLKPEILLIDEALAAGDAAFKLKSMGKIVELCEQDCTVLIVSHGLEVVKALAEGCVWLDRGHRPRGGPGRRGRRRRTWPRSTSRRRARPPSKTCDPRRRHDSANGRRDDSSGAATPLSKRVAQMRMRGNGPPVVVFSMGKTGSTAIARAVQDATGRRVFQVFRLDAERLAEAEERYRASGRAPVRRCAAPLGVGVPAAPPAERGDAVDRHHDGARAGRPGRLGVLPRRRPARPAFGKRAHGRAPGRARCSTTAGCARRCAGSTGSSRPRSASTCSRSPSIPQVGYAVIERPTARVLLLRQENLDAAPEALAEFLGLDRVRCPVAARNEATDKEYAGQYREFLASVAAPRFGARPGLRLPLRPALLCR